MFFIGNIVIGLARVLDMALSIYMWIIIIRALISWVNPDPYNPIVQFLVRVTEPALGPLRRLVPTWRIGIDLSPLIAIFIIYFLRFALVENLMDLGRSMKLPAAGL